MKSDEKTNSIYPPAVERALSILDYMAENTQPLTIKEISNHMHIPHASAYRIVKCLIDFGYLRESPYHPEKYKLGYKPTYLSKMAFNGTDLVTIAIPHLKSLSEKTSQACQLCVLNGGYAITLEQAVPRDAITIIARLGEPIPVNASASGKVLISRMHKGKRKDILTRVWPSYKPNTEYTVTNLETFLEQLDEISKQNYASDFEEYALGIGCMAVPIYDNMQNPIAAIGLTGPIDNYRKQETFDSMLKELLEVSSDITKELFYSGS